VVVAGGLAELVLAERIALARVELGAVVVAGEVDAEQVGVRRAHVDHRREIGRAAAARVRAAGGEERCDDERAHHRRDYYIVRSLAQVMSGSTHSLQTGSDDVEHAPFTWPDGLRPDCVFITHVLQPLRSPSAHGPMPPSGAVAQSPLMQSNRIVCSILACAVAMLSHLVRHACVLHMLSQRIRSMQPMSSID